MPGKPPLLKVSKDKVEQTSGRNGLGIADPASWAEDRLGQYSSTHDL